MKEAAGEANITVITIVLIALVMAAGAFIIPNLLHSVGKKGACSELGGTLNGNSCSVQKSDGTTTNYTCSCSGFTTDKCKCTAG